MVKNYFERRHARAQEDGERGSLILDILIGMAIFALIAIIAVSAVGQYRMRAYEQTAVSDATSTANEINAFLTDTAGKEGLGLPPVPVELDEAARDGLGINVTGTAENTSFVFLSPAPNGEDFEVCVEHKGAYAIYDTADGGLVDSGVMEHDDFDGCDQGDGDWTPPATREECEAAGGGRFWVEARPAETVQRLVYVGDWDDNYESTSGTPWGDGLSRGQYEDAMWERMGFDSVSDVRADWWPTTPVERSEFGTVNEDGSDVLARNGVPVRDDVDYFARDGYCNAN